MLREPSAARCACHHALLDALALASRPVVIQNAGIEVLRLIRQFQAGDQRARGACRPGATAAARRTGERRDTWV